MYISIPWDSNKNSIGRNNSTFVHKKTRDESYIDEIVKQELIKPGFLYWDTNQGGGIFNNYEDADSREYNGPIIVTDRNLNLGDRETTLINHYSDYFTEKMVGYIKIEAVGSYTFSGQADNTGALMINGTIGYITWSGIKTYFTINFDSPGYYPFKYFHGEENGGQIAEVYWTTPTNSSRVSVPKEVLYYNLKDLP